jgi:hypothetical protein
MVASAPALKPRYEAFIRKFMQVTNLTSSQTKRYGTKYAKSGYGPGKSINLKDDFDDTEDLKLDYYHKTIGMSTNRVNVSHDSENPSKTSSNDHSSEDIIFQSISSTDERKNDQITITKTVEIQKSRHR